MWLIPEDNNSLETHWLQLHTSSVTKEKYEIAKNQLKEKKDPNIVFQTFYLLEDNNKTHIKLDHKNSCKKWMIAFLLDWTHESKKSHMKTREMNEYLSNKLNVF